MTNELTLEMIAKNPWAAVSEPLLETTPEEVVLQVYHVTAKLEAETAIRQEEAATSGNIKGARALFNQIVEIQTRDALAKTLLDAYAHRKNMKRMARLDQESANQSVPENLEPRQAPLANTHPQGTNWFKRRGGIDELTADERAALTTDYQAWAIKRPRSAEKRSEGDYCAFRQRRWQERIARLKAQKLA